MNHRDPLCLANRYPASWAPEMCICDVLKQARAEEREKGARKEAVKAYSYQRDTNKHDPFCRYFFDEFTGSEHCDCELISKVRMDELANLSDRLKESNRSKRRTLLQRIGWWFRI